MNNNGIDLGNLEDQVQTAKHRERKVDEFHIRIIFLLVGAVLGIPLQLLVKPLKITKAGVQYQGPMEYPLILLSGLGLIILLVSSAYQKRVGYDSISETRLRLPSDSMDLFTELKSELDQEARFRRLAVAGTQKYLRIFDSSSNVLMNRGEELVFEVEYDSSIDILTISFNQKDERFEAFVELTKETLA